jgi:putative lipoprotein
MLKRLFAGLVALMLLAGPAMAQAITLNGTVTYYERMALPAGSQLRLQLVTLSGNRQIAAAASQITGKASPPIGFSMNLHSTSAQTAGPLGLVAEIRSNGQLFFRSAAPTPIDLASPSGIAIVVSRASAPLPKPAEPSMPEPQILDTSWTVTSIGGRPVIGTRPVTLTIDLDARIGGNATCNRYTSEASLDGDTMTFSPAAATRMACAPELMAQEAAYFAALAAVASYQLDGSSLRLLDAAGIPLIGLVRVSE